MPHSGSRGVNSSRPQEREGGRGAKLATGTKRWDLMYEGELRAVRAQLHEETLSKAVTEDQAMTAE